MRSTPRAATYARPRHSSSPRRPWTSRPTCSRARPAKSPMRCSSTCGLSCCLRSATSCRAASRASPSLEPASSTPPQAAAPKIPGSWRTSHRLLQFVEFAELRPEVTEVRAGICGTSCGVFDQGVRFVLFTVAVYVLPHPPEERAELAPLHLGQDLRPPLDGGIEELDREHVAHGVRREVPEVPDR